MFQREACREKIVVGEDMYNLFNLFFINTPIGNRNGDVANRRPEIVPGRM